MRTCTKVTVYEYRVVAYDVVYDYRGQRYETRVAQIPGERIALDLNVAPAGGAVVTSPPNSPVPRSHAVTVVYAPTPAYGCYGYAEPSVIIGPELVIGGYEHHDYRR